MTPDMMVVTDLGGRKVAGRSGAVHRAQDAPRGVRGPARRPGGGARTSAPATGFAVAGIPLDRAVLAEVITTLGSVPIAEYATPSTDGTADRGAEVHHGARRPAAGQPRRADGRERSLNAYFKMETIEHFAHISLVARRSAASASCPARRSAPPGSAGSSTASRRRRRSARTRADVGRGRRCQLVEAPVDRRASGSWRSTLPSARRRAHEDRSSDAEIRLTYRELAALIEGAGRRTRLAARVRAAAPAGRFQMGEALGMIETKGLGGDDRGRRCHGQGRQGDARRLGEDWRRLRHRHRARRRGRREGRDRRRCGGRAPCRRARRRCTSFRARTATSRTCCPSARRKRARPSKPSPRRQ